MLENGSVIDGTGTPAVLSDVLIEEGRIQELGPFENLAGAIEIDCSGFSKPDLR